MVSSDTFGYMQTIELIHFQVSQERESAFVQERAAVDAWVHGLDGHLGTELVNLSGGQWMMLVRWRDAEAMAKAQKATEIAPEISAWIQENASFRAFQQGELVYSFPG